MSKTLEVHSRQERNVCVVTTEGYINNVGAEKIAEVCSEMLD